MNIDVKQQDEATTEAISAAKLDRLLEETSRTFALAIPYLPEPTRRQVGLAYLLFRIADTFEDAERWPRARQLAALDDFGRLLEDPDPRAARRAAAGWLDEPPCDHAGYLELLAETPAVLAAFAALDAEPRAAIAKHTRRTVDGMAGFVERKTPEGALQLDDLDDLRAYCYVVAGIVGEMLTELFVLGWEAVRPLGKFLRRRAARFGEALQLVNILKDSAADADHGRSFLPHGWERSEIFALARRDIAAARRYVLALQKTGAPAGIVGFTGLPLRLARAALDRIEQKGPGAKLTRPEVYAIAKSLDRALETGEPAIP